MPARTLIPTAALGLLTLLMWLGIGRGQASQLGPALAEESALALDTAQSAASPAMPDSPPSAAAVPRHTRTWTKVHHRRSAKSDVVAVLLPGDTVLADSLTGDWWRVALEGRVLGYVSDRTLASN